MRKIVERTLAGRIGLLLSVLALAHLVGAGTTGLDAQEAGRIPIHGAYRAEDISSGLDSLFDDWRHEIRRRMAAHWVPGLAFAVVDRDEILWAAGFGVRDRETKEPVTPGTVFSVQSISKLFTATLALRAVQDGLLDLDVPVTDYLPDFTVHSRFSERPVEEMTPRHLLQHATGLTHEAPVGNNWDASSPSFEAHVASIRDTWLRYPVGDRYAYSNLGYDLLGYILEERAGISFQEYMERELFEPLGMDASFVDRAGQELCPECARGHWALFSRLPTSIPLTASGGVRVSVEDGARFVQFHLDRGETQDGTQLVESSLLDEIHGRSMVRDEDWPRDFVMGMGVFPSRKANSYSIPSHGGGFGYMASMEWFPEYGIGTVALTNSMDHPQIDDLLGLDLLMKMVEEEMVSKVGDPDVPGPGEVFPPVGDGGESSRASARHEPARFRQEGTPYLGTYRPVFGGGWELAPTADLAESDKRHRYEVYEGDEGYLRLRRRGTEESEPLIEHEPGLFFGAESGEALDFRDEPPTWRNIELERVEKAGTARGPGKRPDRDGAPAGTADLDLERCEVPGLERPARCGSLEVPEDRADPDGRRIDLRVVVVPARERPAEPDPVFFLSGGPGQAATADAASEAAGPIGRRRDMVFVDQRGTGGSRPLSCELGGLQVSAETFLAGRVPRDRLARCREALEADPRRYWTGPAVEDLDDVRAALGYGEINLKGGSYGTRVALVYARRHPEHTRTLILSGVTPMSYRVPLPHPRESQRALDSLAAACEADRSCRGTYGDVDGLLRRVEADLERRSRTVPVSGPALPDSARITLDPGLLRGAVHLSLYDVDTAARLPGLLAAADRGEYRPLAAWAARLTTLFDRALHLGMLFSVICAEDEPRIAPSEVGPATEGTYLGGQYVRGLLSACEVWPAAEVGDDYFEPVSTEVPTLMISGAADPVTPPRWAEKLQRRLPNARHLVVPNRGHTPGLPPCAEELPVRFLDRASTEGLDASCLEAVERPAFEGGGSD